MQWVGFYYISGMKQILTFYTAIIFLLLGCSEPGQQESNSSSEIDSLSSMTDTLMDQSLNDDKAMQVLQLNELVNLHYSNLSEVKDFFTAKGWVRHAESEDKDARTKIFKSSKHQQITYMNEPRTIALDLYLKTGQKNIVICHPGPQLYTTLEKETKTIYDHKGVNLEDKVLVSKYIIADGCEMWFIEKPALDGVITHNIVLVNLPDVKKQSDKILKKIIDKGQPPVALNHEQTHGLAVGSSKLRGGGDPLKGLNVSIAERVLKIGKYYAFLIGIDKYQGEWAPLDNAVNDAKAMESLLRTKYNFDQFNVLYDAKATRSAIIRHLEWLVDNVQEDDNVLIYYSGHGEFKQKLNKGYWVPYDATSKSISEYISNNDIQAFLQGIKSKHTLLVSDACFSGDIFRGNTISVPFEGSEKYYKKVHDLVSRTAITSGGIEPVMDGGREGHSVFAYYLLKSLRDNKETYYDAGQLFNNLKIPVVNNSEQTPKFNPIKNTGDEGGQFIFIKN